VRKGTGSREAACFERKRVVHAVVNEIDQGTDEYHAGIRLPPAEVLAVTTYSIPTAVPQDLTYWAWSEKECRWVSMTFYENQAWLARPDLDPVGFVPYEAIL
jgi:hypothetical protein